MVLASYEISSQKCAGLVPGTLFGYTVMDALRTEPGTLWDRGFRILLAALSVLPIISSVLLAALFPRKLCLARLRRICDIRMLQTLDRFANDALRGKSYCKFLKRQATCLQIPNYTHSCQRMSCSRKVWH